MLNNFNKELYFICGPTAIGKSSFAIRLAKKINGVIINADSMQVYSNLKILTARPSENDHQQVTHKLYGYVDASQRYNVSKWCNDVKEIINENKKNNKSSIIVGGTGMYIDSLLNGLIDLPAISEEIKRDSENLFNKVGLENFIKIIYKVDPEALKNISKNDSSRVKRIWEVYNSTGKKFTDWKLKNNKKFVENFSYKIFLFTPTRDLIYNNVNSRFKDMIKNGAIEEVQKLINLNLSLSLPLMRAHGVLEISNYLKNMSTLQECIEKGQRVTRHYVKRQLTWWRSSSLSIHEVFNRFPIEIDENLIKI